MLVSSVEGYCVFFNVWYSWNELVLLVQSNVSLTGAGRVSVAGNTV